MNDYETNRINGHEPMPVAAQQAAWQAAGRKGLAHMVMGDGLKHQQTMRDHLLERMEQAKYQAARYRESAKECDNEAKRIAEKMEQFKQLLDIPYHDIAGLM